MTLKAIGPSFPDELAAHGGLVGQHFSWQPDGTLEFFEDTPEDVVAAVEAVYAAHDPSKPSWASYQALAKSALDDSDMTVLRCYESGAPLPAEWAAYRKALRAIVSAPSGCAGQLIPTKPAYPAGT